MFFFNFAFFGFFSTQSLSPAKLTLLLFLLSLPLFPPNKHPTTTTYKKKTGVLAPGLVEIAKELPPQWGAAPVPLTLERAEADAVRFDCDGDGDGPMTESRWDEAALTHIDLLEWGILRLGTLCDALPPVKENGH